MRDDLSKICHHLIKLVAAVVVLRDKGFIWDNGGTSSLLFLFQLWQAQMKYNKQVLYRKGEIHTFF